MKRVKKELLSKKRGKNLRKKMKKKVILNLMKNPLKRTKKIKT